MVEVLQIIIPIVISIIILGVSFYLFTLYCHPEEKGLGVEILPKTLVILSQTLAWGQLLLIPLDLSIAEEGNSDSFSIIYAIVYLTIFVFVSFINPFVIFLYEADETDPFLKRILWSLLFTIATTAVWCLVIFVSFIFLSGYSYNGSNFSLSAPMYVFLCMSVVGWFLLAINGGIGLVYLPADLIIGFIKRPKQLTSEEAFSKKMELQTRSEELITIGEKLRTMEQELSRQENSWFTRKRKESKFQKEVNNFKKDVNELETSYEVFDLELKIKTVHPVVYFVMLFFGIISSIISIFWLFQMLGTLIYNNGQPIYHFIDDWLNSLAVSSVGFIGVLLYGIFVLYLQACLVKGNTVFGLRIPFIVKFHPMELNKTYLNSLLFNSNIMMLSSVATSVLSVWAFPTYLKQTYLGTLSADAFNNEPLFSTIYGQRIPMGVFMGISIIALIVMIVKLIWFHLKKKKSSEGKIEQDHKLVKE